MDLVFDTISQFVQRLLLAVGVEDDQGPGALEQRDENTLLAMLTKPIKKGISSYLTVWFVGRSTSVGQVPRASQKRSSGGRQVPLHFLVFRSTN